MVIGDTENLLNFCSGQGSLLKSGAVAGLGVYISLIRSPVFQSIPCLLASTVANFCNSPVCCQEAGKSNAKAVVSTRACEDFALLPT